MQTAKLQKTHVTFAIAGGLFTVSTLASMPYTYAQSHHKGKIHKNASASADQISDEVWQPDVTLVKQLDPEFSLGEYSIRPPQGYHMSQNSDDSDPATSIKFFWNGVKRSDLTHPELTVQLSFPKPGYRPHSPREGLMRLEQAIQSHLQKYTQSQIEDGSIGNIEFSRVYWKGYDKLHPSQVHGFTYQGVVGSSTITIIGHDNEPYNKATLPLLEASAETFMRS